MALPGGGTERFWIMRCLGGCRLRQGSPPRCRGAVDVWETEMTKPVRGRSGELCRSLDLLTNLKIRHYIRPEARQYLRYPTVPPLPPPPPLQAPFHMPRGREGDV